MAALAVGKYFDVEDDKLIEAISTYQPENKRSQLMTTTKNKIYLDAYNANPTSMQNALESFAGIDMSPKVAILGDMLELGEDSSKEHLATAESLKTNNFDAVILIGPEFVEAGKDSGFNVFSDTAQANKYLSQNPLKDCFILLKGSRGIGLENLLDNL